MGESPTGGASSIEGDSLDWSRDIKVLELSFEELYSDDVRVGAAPSIEHIEPICTKSFDLTPYFIHFIPTTPSHLHAFHESLDDTRGYNPYSNPYCAHQEDKPRKIE